MVNELQTSAPPRNNLRQVTGAVLHKCPSDAKAALAWALAPLGAPHGCGSSIGHVPGNPCQNRMPGGVRGQSFECLWAAMFGNLFGVMNY